MRVQLRDIYCEALQRVFQKVKVSFFSSSVVSRRNLRRFICAKPRVSSSTRGDDGVRY